MSTLSALGTGVTAVSSVANGGDTSILTDGTTQMRWIQVGDYMEMQLTLTPTGFAGIKDTDYEAVETIYIYKQVDDWYLPTEEELDFINANLYQQSIGNIKNSTYWTSTEAWNVESPITHAVAYVFTGGSGSDEQTKGSLRWVRPCRTFTDLADAYELGDIGPSGGWIFYIDGTDYYEAAKEDLPTTLAWSNITNAGVGGTSPTIGTGQANTTAIIGQALHTASAAKQSDDYINS